MLKYSNNQIRKYSNIKYSNTQILRYSNTQIPKYSNTELLKYKLGRPYPRLQDFLKVKLGRSQENSKSMPPRKWWQLISEGTMKTLSVC